MTALTECLINGESLACNNHGCQLSGDKHDLHRAEPWVCLTTSWQLHDCSYPKVNTHGDVKLTLVIIRTIIAKGFEGRMFFIIFSW